jgi:hypothetical protein
MSGEESTGNAPKTNVETSVADDKRSIMLKLGIGESAPMVVPLDTTAVDLLISTLGAARSEMIEPIPADLSGTFPITAYNPRWYPIRPKYKTSYSSCFGRAAPLDLSARRLSLPI